MDTRPDFTKEQLKTLWIAWEKNAKLWKRNAWIMLGVFAAMTLWRWMTL